MELDQVSIGIINRLKDGRVPFRQIADELGVAEGTVRSRVKKMQHEGILQISGFVDPEHLGEHSVVMVGVRVKDMDLVKKGEEFTGLKGVTSVCVVTGRYDLIVTVLLNKSFSILEFYTEEVAKLDNIRSVETFVIYKSFDLKVPLVAWEGMDE